MLLLLLFIHTLCIASRHFPPRKDIVNQCLEFGVYLDPALISRLRLSSLPCLQPHSEHHFPASSSKVTDVVSQCLEFGLQPASTVIVPGWHAEENASDRVCQQYTASLSGSSLVRCHAIENAVGQTEVVNSTRPLDAAAVLSDMPCHRKCRRID